MHTFIKRLRVLLGGRAWCDRAGAPLDRRTCLGGHHPLVTTRGTALTAASATHTNAPPGAMATLDR